MNTNKRTSGIEIHISVDICLSLCIVIRVSTGFISCHAKCHPKYGMGKLPRIYPIAAVCSNGGIGKNNSLPWNLPKDFKFFNTQTKTTKDPNLKNAVIMGRRTWESIPNNGRPLKQRINVIVSSGMKEAPDAVDTFLVTSFDEAIALLTENADLSSRIERIYAIGGYGIYKSALDSEHAVRLYYTRVKKEFDCDAFFPNVEWEKFQKVQDDDLPTGEFIDNGVEYEFEAWDRD